MASPSQPPVPTASPVERIQQAYAARAQSDYIFSFWTAFGWTLLTCGIYGALGANLALPTGTPKQPHNYVARVIVAIVTFGIYLLWWLYNMMDDLNRHFEENWAWEDNLRHALGG